MEEDSVIEIMSTVEPDGVRIMRCEFVISVHHRILRPEQPVHSAGFAGDIPERLHGGSVSIHRCETSCGNLTEIFEQALVHEKRGLSVPTGAMIFLPPEAVVLQYGVRQVKCRIDNDSVMAMKQFRVHPAHRCPDDKVRLLILAQRAEHLHGILRPDGKIRGNDSCGRQQDSHRLHGAVQSPGSESVDIEYSLAGHQVRPCIFI